ncbi:unnamed protein product, partial [Strongylus vulgaris]
MDILYDIHVVDADLNKVTAHASPLKLCWKSSLRVSAAPGTETFENMASEECHSIEGTEVTDFLRQMNQYSVEKHNSAYELVVETGIHENTEEAFITLTAQDIAKDGAQSRTKTFSTGNSNGTFRIPLLPDSVYAVQYQYTKVKPFHYTSEEHFLVETTSDSDNLTESSNPLVEAYFEVENHTLSKDEIIQIPTVSLFRGEAYSTADITITMDPLCEETNISSVTFSNEQPSAKLDLMTAVCSNFPQADFCNETD